MKVLFVFVFLILTEILFAQKGGILSGNVTDNYYGEGIAFGTIIVENVNKTIAIGNTNADGFYCIKSLPPGIYDVHISALNYGATLTQQVKIEEGGTAVLNKVLSLNGTVNQADFHQHVFSNGVVCFGSNGVVILDSNRVR